MPILAWEGGKDQDALPNPSLDGKGFCLRTPRVSCALPKANTMGVMVHTQTRPLGLQIEAPRVHEGTLDSSLRGTRSPGNLAGSLSAPKGP